MTDSTPLTDDELAQLDPLGAMSTGRERWEGALNGLRYGVDLPASLRDHAVDQIRAAVEQVRKELSSLTEAIAAAADIVDEPDARYTGPDVARILRGLLPR